MKPIPTLTRHWWSRSPVFWLYVLAVVSMVAGAAASLWAPEIAAWWPI